MANPIVIIVLCDGLGRGSLREYAWMYTHFLPDREQLPGKVDLVFFDYPGGVIKEWKAWTFARGKKEPPSPTTTTPIPNLVRPRKENGKLKKKEVGSVVELYTWVKSQKKGSIKALHVYSHSSEQGPAVWDTYQFTSAGKKMPSDLDLDRDPHDTDFRVRDFFGNNPLAGSAGRAFADAFAPDASIKLWGCNAMEGQRSVVRDYLDQPTGADGDPKREALLKVHVDALIRSFPVALAEQLNLKVWASPLGWGSDYSEHIPITGRRHLKVSYQKTFPPDLKKDQWWRVSWFFKNYDHADDFYTKVLNASIDAVHYVLYERAWIGPMRKKLAKADAPAMKTAPVESPYSLQQRLTDRIAALFPRIGGGQDPQDA